MVIVGPISRQLEAVARFRLTTGHELFGVYFHWLPTRPAWMPGWMVTDYSNILDSMNARQKKSSFGTGRLGFK
ncbi:hypothetical protein TNCV_1403311 [Trichonephila clavipes]|nr:hypothetical protein TNCV_1403311 [Trichonephila clavipes]